MKRIISFLGICFIVFFAQNAIARSLMSKTTTPIMSKLNGDNDGNLVINGRISTFFNSDRRAYPLSGRVSAYFKITKTNLEKGLVPVTALNIAQFGFPQEAVTGKAPRGKARGVLGFVINQDEGEQYLFYNSARGTLSGVLKGRVDMQQFSELASVKNNGRTDDFQTPTQPAVLSVVISLGDLDPYSGGRDISTSKGDINFNLKTKESSTLQAKGYTISLQKTPVDIQVSWFHKIEVAKKLCIQPVRIVTLRLAGKWFPKLYLNYSGDGLNFGMPGANKEWAKADVIFNVRNWMTLWKPQYSTLSASEANSLRSEVSVDDCVEVFFVDKFSPSDKWGGGATWSGGQASTQIISSDENAVHGIDLTHLGHELGHAMTLKHPSSGYPNAANPTRVDGSTGTLMCPSGFMNDNPQVNSQWNKDSVSNPLFTFSLKVRTTEPDCDDDADCGACS